MGCTSTASAALISRLGGLAVYDTDRNITWLANANAANGTLNWQAAKDWAAGLNVGGYTGWRLPNALNTDGSGPCLSFNCPGSELGHLYYTEGGLSASNSINSSAYLKQFFTNMLDSNYWFSKEYAPDTTFAYVFQAYNGAQTIDDKNTGISASWAVRDGDVSGGGSVPEPGIIGLMGIGALAWRGTRSRRLG
jgi:hypothetical protein